MKLDRVHPAGAVTMMLATALAGCGFSSRSLWGSHSGGTSASLASHSSNVPAPAPAPAPVHTSAQPTEARSNRRNTSDTPPSRGESARRQRVPSPPAGAERPEGLVIEPGRVTSADTARQATTPDEQTASLLESATVLELRGNLEAARQQYDQALAAAPNDTQTVLGFARFADRHGQGTMAAELYQRLLESGSANPVLSSEAGVSLARNGHPDAGLVACRRAVAEAPDNQRFQANLAEVETIVERMVRATPRPGDGAPALPGRVLTIPVSVARESALASNPEPAPTRPYTPGSTARQFERPLPPVVSSRRNPDGIRTAARPTTDERTPQ